MIDASTYEIMETWAAALYADATLTALFTDLYGKAADIRIGASQMPGEEDAPFIHLMPGGDQTGDAEKVWQRGVHVVLGVFDREWVTTSWGRNLRSLSFLSQRAIPELMRVLDRALPGASPSSVETSWLPPDFFPLMEAHLLITINDPRPVTGRR